LCIVDQAIASLNTRFEQYKEFEDIFGFLFTLRSMDDDSLKVACLKLEAALKHGNHRDIDGEELWQELIFIQDLLEKSMGPLDILKFLEKRPTCPIANIAYRILLTIPVTAAGVFLN
jgi:hypothetical protein